MSFADIAIAAQLSLLRFPKSSGEPLAGKGCPGFSDHPNLQVLFDWRDRIETTLMQSDLEQSPKKYKQLSATRLNFKDSTA